MPEQLSSCMTTESGRATWHSDSGVFVGGRFAGQMAQAGATPSRYRMVEALSVFLVSWAYHHLFVMHDNTSLVSV